MHPKQEKTVHPNAKTPLPTEYKLHGFLCWVQSICFSRFMDVSVWMEQGFDPIIISAGLCWRQPQATMLCGATKAKALSCERLKAGCFVNNGRWIIRTQPYLYACEQKGSEVHSVILRIENRSVSIKRIIYKNSRLTVLQRKHRVGPVTHTSYVFLSPQSFQHSRLAAAVSCGTARSSGDIQQWTQYHRLPSGGSWWVSLKDYVAWWLLTYGLFLCFFYIVFMSAVFRRKSHQEVNSSKHFEGALGCILSPANTDPHVITHRIKQRVMFQTAIETAFGKFIELFYFIVISPLTNDDIFL